MAEYLCAGHRRQVHNQVGGSPGLEQLLLPLQILQTHRGQGDSTQPTDVVSRVAEPFKFSSIADPELMVYFLQKGTTIALIFHLSTSYQYLFYDVLIT